MLPGQAYAIISRTPQASPAPCEKPLHIASRKVSDVDHHSYVVVPRKSTNPRIPKKYCKASKALSPHDAIYTKTQNDFPIRISPVQLPISSRPSNHRMVDSTPSSILAGIPPPNPCDAVASIRATFALCESVLWPSGDLCCLGGTDIGSALCSTTGKALGRAGDAEAPDSLSLFWDEVRGVTRPFCGYFHQSYIVRVQHSGTHLFGPPEPTAIAQIPVSTRASSPFRRDACVTVCTIFLHVSGPITPLPLLLARE